MKLSATLITALCLAGCIHVRAQSTETGTSTSHGVSTEGPSAGGGAVCNITTLSLPSGTQGVVYGPITLTTAGCTAPLTWTITVGSLPTGLSLNSVTGVISGTPSGSGSSSFTVHVLDANLKADIFDTGLSITSAAPGNGPALPDSNLLNWDTSVANTPSPNTVITVGDGSISPCDQTGGTCSYSTAQIATALAAVGCGQTLELQNTVYTLSGTIKLIKNCDSFNWITITRDFSDTTFPTEGIRVTPCYAGVPSSALPGEPPYACPSPARHMPLLQKNTANAVIQFGSNTVTDPGSASYRFIGIQWGRATTYDLDFGIIVMPNNNGCVAADANCMNHQPNHIIFDRNILDGDAQRQTTRGLDIGGTWIAVIDSYIHDIKLSFAGGGGDAQSFHGGSGKFITNVGEWKLQNDFASASTETGGIFCGNAIAPVSPITTFDGVPHDIWWTQQRDWKNPLWDPMIGQALNETITIDGVGYGPVGDQEFLVTPSAIQVQQGHTLDIHNVTMNDSGGGLDRMTDASGAGSVTIDGLACTYTTTTIVGATPAGATSIVIASPPVTANIAINHSILITGAGAGGSNYIGTVTAISGTTLTISPATTVAVATGISVYDPVCVPGGLATGDSTHGHILKNSSHQVGSGPYVSNNIISWTYIACSGAGVPYIDCTGATTAAAHTLVFNKVVSDGRAATMGNNRTLTSTSTITVTSGAPTNQIALSPSAPDLQLQPSYSDSFGNVRQYADTFFATLNFTSVSLTWKVDGVVNGDSSVGQICLATAAPCSAPGSNDTNVVYVSGTATGNHTVSVVSAAGTTASQVINVTTSAPILAYDLKPFTSKNGWESKCVSRGLFDKSVIENVWGTQANGGFQPGEFILNQPINQGNQTTDGNGATVGYGPEHINDLTVDHIHGIHAGKGLIVAGLAESLGIHRITYSNLLLEDLNARRWVNGVQILKFAGDLQFIGAGGTTVLGWTNAANPLTDNIKFDHLTTVGGTTTNPGVANWLSIGNNNAQFQLGPFSWTNSIDVVPGALTFNNNNGDVPDCNTAANQTGLNNSEAKAFQGTGYTPAKPCFSTYDISHNALPDNTSPAGVFTTATIWQPSSADADLFRNPSTGDYRVVSGGRYDAGGARDAGDGLALGADVAGIYNNDQAVRSGIRTGFPMTITTASLPNATHNVAYSQALSVSGGTAPYTWTTPADIVPADATDILDYAAMTDRNNFHLSGTLNKYFKVDAGLLWWLKSSSGNPWDGELIGPDYIKQWFTEGDSFNNASGFKMYVNPVSLWKRYHVPGADDVVYTPGPNNYSTTANCGADGSPLIDNLGVRGELTGPFTDITWQSTFGGNIPDNTPYLLAQKWIKCTSNDITHCTNEEDYWLVKGYGQVQWCPKTWNGSTYVTGTCTRETTKTAGGAPAPNFACGLPQPPSSTLPPGTPRASAPAMTLVDSTGVISGTPTTAGTYTVTVQVQDANGLMAQKTLTLTVQ